eukprot:TRINITY_DN44762_c0_g1_i1.p1 TRINITY_DN44762_c0_g1~~TRINITY_DN44762_c0_g1_i1.p1  ORF type:complete len:450 (-),score=52.66 TRINITY_DN44762_c0_g1_i1:172-1521(-)
MQQNNPSGRRSAIDVVVRVRPLVKEELEAKDGALSLTFPDSASSWPTPFSISATTTTVRGAEKEKTWQFANFGAVLPPEANNRATYENVMVRTKAVENVARGNFSSCFCYGYTGAGKTHTILGYREELGLFHHAATELCCSLAGKTSSSGQPLSLQIRFAELYNNRVFDLLAPDRPECSVRENEDGGVHIRAATQMDEKGRVSVRPLTPMYARTEQEVHNIMAAGTKQRSAGKSTVHDQSSRSHAILEMEIVSQELIDARNQLIEREADAVPPGKARDGYLLMGAGVCYGRENGQFIFVPGVSEEAKEKYIREFTALDDPAEAAMQLVYAAQRHEKAILQESRDNNSVVGGTLVLVDLAGADVDDATVKQTPQQRKEATEINKSLLALKECIRALDKNKDTTHVPFRNSKLTHLLKRFLVPSSSISVMVANMSPSERLLKKNNQYYPVR